MVPGFRGADPARPERRAPRRGGAPAINRLADFSRRGPRPSGQPRYLGATPGTRNPALTLSTKRCDGVLIT